MKKKITRGLLGLLGVGFVVLGSIKEHETDCEIYQGYINRSGEVMYVFDSNPFVLKIKGPAEHSAFGNPSLKDSLKIGEKYCFETEQSIMPRSRKKIKAIEPYNIHFAEKPH